MPTKPSLTAEFPTNEIHVEHNGFAWLVNSHFNAEHHFDRLSDAVSYAMHLRNHLPTMRLFVVLHCGAASALRQASAAKRGDHFVTAMSCPFAVGFAAYVHWLQPSGQWAPAGEEVMWVLTRRRRRAHVAVRILAHGFELRVYVDDQLVIRQLHRIHALNALLAQSAAHLNDFKDLGWQQVRS